MRKFAKVAMAGALTAATLGGMAAPAEAHIGAGGAIIAGLAGLGIGAAIASDHPHRYYGGGYGGGYAPSPVDYGYAPPPPPPPGPLGYYAPPPPPSYGYEEVRECRVSQRWDGWQGRYVPVRRCW
jgi:hypothetical protein